MSDQYRLSIELPSGAKFQGDGPAHEVRTDLAVFYERFANNPSTPTTATKTETNGAVFTDIAFDTNGDTAVDDGLSPQMRDRLFAKDRNGTVSLRALPQGENAEGNALLALIYGASMIGNEQQVTGSRLMKAATQSGLQVDRIDRSLASAVGPYVTTAGFKKGRKYGLTNPGFRRAEEILRAILN